MYVDQADEAQLVAWESELAQQLERFASRGLNLDLTRGKPSADQLSLANALDGCLNGNYLSPAGEDTRNYGNLEGLPELKTFAAELLQVSPDNLLIGGNSSLSLMYLCVLFAWQFGVREGAKPWKDEAAVKFLCPSPGYDRHFSICEEFGIEMIPVGIGDDGPDMDAVEELITNDPAIKGIWCVPKYSNPTGCVYSDETVERLAKLGTIASDNFRVFYDNAYVVHDLYENPPQLAAISNFCKQFATEDSVLQFSSTSKVTFAGAGVSFLASSPANLAKFKKHLGMLTIGNDKVNQLRHLRFISSMDQLKQHMNQHAKLLRPRFNCVLEHLQKNFAESDLGQWSNPQGGYFVSFDARPGTAKQIVELAAQAGVKLTPAGASFPYGKDPKDSNIRLAPSFPSLEDIDLTMQVFCTCVKLAGVRQKLTQ